MKLKDQRMELERMINGSDDSIDKNVVPDLGGNPELHTGPTFDADFDKIQKECDSQARRLIKNATGFILTDELVKQNPYLKNKMQVDILSLSGMLYQLKMTETMQRSLAEEVRNGAVHPRMYEVFGKLTDSIRDLNKQLLQTVEAIKSTYKDIKFDFREKENELKAIGPGQNGIVRNGKGLVALGTKELINETKKLKMATTVEIQDVEEVKTQESPKISEESQPV